MFYTLSKSLLQPDKVSLLMGVWHGAGQPAGRGGPGGGAPGPGILTRTTRPEPADAAAGTTDLDMRCLKSD